MSQFEQSWRLSRGRFVQCLEGMTQPQLNYRLYPGSLTIGEMAIHVAGVEASFMRQLLGLEVNQEQMQVVHAATDGVVNDQPFPFLADEITPIRVAAALEWTRELVEPHVSNPSPEFLVKELVSALGPVITGEGALARFAFHPAYHHGQAYQIQQSPGFPK